MPILCKGGQGVSELAIKRAGFHSPGQILEVAVRIAKSTPIGQLPRDSIIGRHKIRLSADKVAGVGSEGGTKGQSEDVVRGGG